MSFFSEFKKFALRGNVIDLAVAVVIGAAFGKIVSSLVDGIIMPLIGLMLGGINIANKTFTLDKAVVKWGLFLQSVVDFTLIAFSIFIVIQLLNKLRISTVSPPSKEVQLLTEIRDLLEKKNDSNRPTSS